MFRYIAAFLVVCISSAGLTQDHRTIPRLPKKSIRFLSPFDGRSASRAAAGDPIRVLAVRVEFREDENELTSGIGTFDYSEETGAVVDPPPHDRQYFLDHLEALDRYFTRVSDGAVSISSDLYPPGDRSAYVLPHEMSYYNPNTTEDELDIRLSELMQDAFLQADSDPGIDFFLLTLFF